jgi:hypothetical protein
MPKKPYIIMTAESDDFGTLENKVKNHLANDYIIFGPPMQIGTMICQAMILNDPTITPKITYYRI